MDISIWLGLIGVIIGSIIPIVGNHFSSRKELKLKLSEKIIDKRIAAHEELYRMVMSIRQIVNSNTFDEEGNVVGYPACLDSHDSFNRFWSDSFFIIHKNSPWINASLKRELWFFQDYVVNLNGKIDFGNLSELYNVKHFIKQDFIDLSGDIEKEIDHFCEKDIFSLKAIVKKEWHKYPKEQTLEKLNLTRLFIYYKREGNQ